MAEFDVAICRGISEVMQENIPAEISVEFPLRLPQIFSQEICAKIPEVLRNNRVKVFSSGASTILHLDLI